MPSSNPKQEVVQHSTHVHPLTLAVGHIVCDGCNEVKSGKVYYCADCNYHLDEFCAICPTTLRSVMHPKHRLKLIWGGPIHFCDICTESVKGVFCYRCDACDFDIHPRCMPQDEVLRHNEIIVSEAALKILAIQLASNIVKGLVPGLPINVLVTTFTICIENLIAPNFDARKTMVQVLKKLPAAVFLDVVKGTPHGYVIWFIYKLVKLIASNKDLKSLVPEVYIDLLSYKVTKFIKSLLEVLKGVAPGVSSESLSKLLTDFIEDLFRMIMEILSTLDTDFI